MARPIAQIYDAIIAEKETQSSLSGLLPNNDNATDLMSDLTSGSKVAIWRLFAYLIAVAMHTEEVLWDLFKVEVERIAAAAPAGTVRWYRSQIFAFQFGDNLIYENEKYDYATLNEAAQIIKYCAIQERTDGVVIVKAAKEVSDAPEVLTTTELDALESYAQKIKFAGTRLAVVSLEADNVAPDYQIFYDPIIPLSEVQSSTQTVIDNYLNSLDFDAEFNINDFTDFLQQVPGINDPIFNAATATTADATVTNFGIGYIPASGYFEYADTAANMFTWTQQIEQ